MGAKGKVNQLRSWSRKRWLASTERQRCVHNQYGQVLYVYHYSLWFDGKCSV